MELVNNYFIEMLGWGTASNDIIYTTLIDGHCKDGNTTGALFAFRLFSVTGALSAFRLLLGQRVIPDIQTIMSSSTVFL